MRRSVLLPVLGASILVLVAAAALLFFGEPAAAQAQEPAWDGIVPPELDEGAKYRILFVTRTQRDAASEDIADYNSFVQGVADAATGNPFGGVTFKALGSTSDVDARCNTLTHVDVSHCDGTATVDDVPIYYYRGTQVAGNYAGFYDGAWDSHAPMDENGTSLGTGISVFTGSNADGTAHNQALGAGPQVKVGMPLISTQEISSALASSKNTQRHFYALSAVLTAPDIDYDEDEDGLIEVSTLAQLNAMRWDLEGDGAPDSANSDDYAAAFPHALEGMGCGWDDPETTETTTACRGYELMADLDFDTDGDGATHTGGVGDADDDYYNADSGWEPIGTVSDHFSTTFEGNSNTIANLFINRGSATVAGLFGVGGVNSEFRNVGLVNLYVHGSDFVGGLVGTAAATISASYATGSVSGRDFVGGLVGDAENNRIDASYYVGSVNGRDFVGGLVGENGSSAGEISASYATGSVSGNSNIGGLVGLHNSGAITNSYATGSISGNSDVGGLVGEGVSSAITDSYATGSVSGNSDVGGLVGRLQSSTVTASYWDKDTSGIADDADTDSPEGRTTTQLQAPTSASGIYAAWDSTVWDFGDAGRYPALKYDTDGDGTATAAEFGGQGRDLPARVRGVSAQVTAADAITLTWDAPDDGGSAITGYTVERSEDGGATWAAQSHSGTTTSFTQSGLNVETTYSYRVKATNTNGDSVAWSETASAAFNSAPTFDQGDSTTRTVAENTAAGQNIGLPVAATDPDSGETLTYALRGADAASFAIVSTSGQLQTAAALDFETETEYEVTVTVTDSGNLTDTIDVNISVTNVNEAPSFSAATASRTVAENTATGQNIGSALSATDPDSGDTLTYTLGGTDASSFTIVSTSGQLRTSAALDFETEDEYEVTVTVTDGGNLTDTIEVVINVTNVNEPGTVAISPAQPKVGVELTAALTDPDGGVTGATWQWARSADGSAWTDIAGATSAGYTPTGDDYAHHLQATASYTDAVGPNQSAAADTAGKTHSVDRDTLIAVYDATGGDDWDFNTKWKTADPIGEWHGVTVDAKGRVINLGLASNNLQGEIPTQLSSLAMLQLLELGSNELSGTIPPDLSSLTNLQALNLGNNDLEGGIPTQLSALVNLQALHLDRNQLTGGIPTQLSALVNLVELELADNDLSGQIPTELGTSLTNLRSLKLSGNQLTGCVPGEWESVPNNDFPLLQLPFCGRSVTISLATVETAEDGGTAEYTVVLDADPSGTVTIALTSDDTGTATVMPATLTFTTGDWDTEQTVTATAVDDDRYNDPARAATISHAVSGGGYDFVTAPSVTVTATDDDPSPPASCTVTARWCATLLVGEEDIDEVGVVEGRGYCRPASGLCGDSDKYGKVSDPDFTLDGTDYTVESVRFGLNEDDDWYLSLTLDQELPQDTIGQLTLFVRRESFTAWQQFSLNDGAQADDRSAFAWVVGSSFYNREPGEGRSWSCGPAPRCRRRPRPGFPSPMPT